jgi:O-antigen/teichoic acid export membrane protein
MAEEAAAQRAGERGVKNTLIRAVGEIVGKLASLLLFAALARSAGQEGLGAFVLAFAFLQIAMVPIDLGFDRYLIREVARDRARADELVFNVLALRLSMAVPIIGLSFLAVNLLGYDAEVRETVYVLAGGLLIDLLTKTVLSFCLAHERNDLVAISVVVQRVGSAALGLALLGAGYGVVAVAASYTAGSAVGFVLACALTARAIGTPRLEASGRGWRRLTAASFPFAAEDVFTVLLFRVDAVILSLMAAEAAVGRYGAAYRLLEATFFLTYSLSGAFSPMYAYLTRESEPTVGAVYQRSINFALVVLVPCAISFGILAEPLCELFFGDDFAAAADPLRLLAPVVVLLCVATLSSALIVSRRDPRIMIAITGAMVALNVALNVALIPEFDDTGAAAAMLGTELVMVAIVLSVAARVVGGLRWVPLLVAPLLAGAAMAGPMLALEDSFAAALAVGMAVYAVVLLAVERVTNPAELRFVGNMIGRLRGRVAA